MSPRREAGLGLIALGAGIAVSAVLGPLALKLIEFRTSESIENQFVGGEVVSLSVVAPALIVAGALTLRGRRLAPVLALGPCLYAVYTYTTVVVGQEYALYEGNVEKFFPLYAALVLGGAALAVDAWRQLGAVDPTLIPDRLRHWLAPVFIGLGVFFALTWAAQIRLVYIGEPPTEYQEAPTLFWLIKFLDLGFVIPALVGTGIGLLRGWPLAVKATYAVAPFGTCLVGAVAGMAVAMDLRDDPSASSALLAVASTAAVGLAALSWRLIVGFMGRGGSQPAPRGVVRTEPTA